MPRKKKKNNNFFTNLLIVLIALLVFFQINLKSNAATLKFAQLSDSHISDRQNVSSYKYLTLSDAILKDAVFQINMLPDIDFVFHTGDSVDSPKEKLISRFISEMNELNVPWYLVFGNHDVSIDGGISKKYYIKKLNETNNNYTFDLQYYSFIPKKGFKVIGLDSIITGKITANGRIDEKQKNWLKNEIENTQQDTFILIFLHVPVVEPFSSPHHKLLNGEEISKMLKSFNRPIAVFNGHYHTTKINRDGNVIYVSSPALVTYPYAFRIVEINNKRETVSLKFVYKLSGVEQLKREGSGTIIGSSIYLGSEKDRTTTVEINKKTYYNK